MEKRSFAPETRPVFDTAQVYCFPAEQRLLLSKVPDKKRQKE
jgi:hypothetical protein